MRQRHSKPVLQYPPGENLPGVFLWTPAAQLRKEILKSRGNPVMISTNGQEVSAWNMCDTKEERHAKKGPGAGSSVCLAGV